MSTTYQQLEPVIQALDNRIKTNLGAFPTDTAEGSIVSFPDGADGIPLKSLVVDINPVQSGSGDPSPDNVRPISGWTGVQLYQTGANVWDEEWEVGGIEPTNGRNNEQTNRLRSKNYIPCRPSTTYWFKKADNTQSYRTVYYDKSQTFIESSNLMSTSAEFTTPGNCYFMRFFSMNPVYSGDISINYPSTDHDYHPYTGRAIAISLGQTVYGGKLDVLSGVLTVDRAIVTLAEVFCAKNVSNYETFRVNLSEAMATGTNIALVQCSTWKGVSQDLISSSSDNYVWGSSVNSTIRIKSTAHENMTVDEFKAAFADTKFVYKLATPITIQLTPHEVKSLLGQNNIFADTGDTEVEYRADTKLYIERLIEPDADMIADANIVSGQYFMVGNKLYLATANIASGSAVIVGTNATRKSLSEALNEINQ